MVVSPVRKPTTLSAVSSLSVIGSFTIRSLQAFASSTRPCARSSSHALTASAKSEVLFRLPIFNRGIFHLLWKRIGRKIAPMVTFAFICHFFFRPEAVRSLTRAAKKLILERFDSPAGAHCQFRITIVSSIRWSSKPERTRFLS